jgi:hypothetical protein
MGGIMAKKVISRFASARQNFARLSKNYRPVVRVTTLAFALTATQLVAPPAKATDLHAVLDEPIQKYLAVAFSAQHQLLEKFDGSGNISAHLQCLDMDSGLCDESLKVMQSVVANNKNFSLSFPAAGGPLNFIFGKSTDVAKKAAEMAAVEMTKENIGNYSDISDPLCSIFVKSSGSTIEQSTVIVAYDQPLLRQKVCLYLLTPRALGIKMFGDHNFASLWTSQEVNWAQLEKGLPNMILAISNRIYIHECMQLTNSVGWPAAGPVDTH